MAAAVAGYPISMSTPDPDRPDPDPDRPADHETRLRLRREQEQAPMEEFGEGVSEGFEQTEAELIDHASHGDQHNTTPIVRDSWDEAEEDVSADDYGEADGEQPEDLGPE